MSGKFMKRLSPIGTARYAYLHTINDRFSPIFKVDLIVPKEECREFCQWLDERNQESYEDQVKKHSKDKKHIKKYPPYQLDIDDDGEETGNVIFKFKTLPTTQKKDGSIVEKRLKAFDSNAKPIDPPPMIGPPIS